VSALYTFVLAMVQHPEVARKAQADIDRVVGQRLPDFSDQESLPYISAIIQEVLRWKPVAPLVRRDSKNRSPLLIFLSLGRTAPLDD
jgi:cytochrome P450